MQIKYQKKNGLKSGKNKEPVSLSKKKKFLLLSNSQKSKILKQQAEKMFNYYQNDEQWKEFQALDVKDE